VRKMRWRARRLAYIDIVRATKADVPFSWLLAMLRS
jgi:hypothetical protein